MFNYPHNQYFIEHSFLSAAKNGNKQLLITSLNAGVNLEVQNDDQKTALWLAVSNGHSKCLQILICANANPDHCPRQHLMMTDGWTPIMHAARKGHVKCVELLINAGANLQHHKFNMNPFMIAAFHGKFQCVELFITVGCDVDRGPRAIRDRKKEL